MLLAGSVVVESTLLAGTVGAALLVATAILPTVPVKSSTAGDLTFTRRSWVVLTPESVNLQGVGGALNLGCPNIDLTEAWAHNVPQARLCILVNSLSKSVDTEMWGEKPRIIFFTVQVHVGLEEGHRVGVIEVLNRAKEDTAPSTIGVVIVHLALEAKE
jgi:hypothetical protein